MSKSHGRRRPTLWGQQQARSTGSLPSNHYDTRTAQAVMTEGTTQMTQEPRVIYHIPDLDAMHDFADEVADMWAAHFDEQGVPLASVARNTRRKTMRDIVYSLESHWPQMAYMVRRMETQLEGTLVDIANLNEQGKAGMDIMRQCGFAVRRIIVERQQPVDIGDLEKSYTRCANQTGGVPSDEEVAALLGVTTERVERTRGILINKGWSFTHCDEVGGYNALNPEKLRKKLLSSVEKMDAEQLQRILAELAAD